MNVKTHKHTHTEGKRQWNFVRKIGRVLAHKPNVSSMKGGGDGRGTRASDSHNFMHHISAHVSESVHNKLNKFGKKKDNEKLCLITLIDAPKWYDTYEHVCNGYRFNYNTKQALKSIFQCNHNEFVMYQLCLCLCLCFFFCVCVFFVLCLCVGIIEWRQGKRDFLCNHPLIYKNCEPCLSLSYQK